MSKKSLEDTISDYITTKLTGYLKKIEYLKACEGSLRYVEQVFRSSHPWANQSEEIRNAFNVLNLEIHRRQNDVYSSLFSIGKLVNHQSAGMKKIRAEISEHYYAYACRSLESGDFNLPSLKSVCPGYDDVEIKKTLKAMFGVEDFEQLRQDETGSGIDTFES